LSLSWIYSAMSIGYIVSSLTCGFIADRISNIHRLQSALIAMTSLCVIAIPFTSSAAVAFVLFSLIGVGWAANETHGLLLVLRLFGQNAFFLATILVLSMCGAVPLMIQSAMEYTDSFAAPFLGFGVVGLVHSALILSLETPRFDALRSLKRQIELSQTANSPKSTSEVMREVSPSPSPSALNLEPQSLDVDIEVMASECASVLRADPSHRRLQNLTLILLLSTMAFHGAIVKGLSAFATPFVSEFLSKDDQFGRYLITCYFWATLSYRVVRSALCPSFSIAAQCTASFVVGFALMIALIFFSDVDADLRVLSALYAVIGFCTGAVLPGLCGWAELIRPTTGIIASLWWAAYGLGDAAVTLAMGALIQNTEIGVGVLPYAVSVPMFCAMLCVIASAIMFRSLKRKESAVLERIQLKHAQLHTPTSMSARTEIQ